MPTRTKSKVAPAEWPDKKFIGVRMTVGQYKKIRAHLTGEITLFETHTWEKKEDRGMWEMWLCPVCRVVRVDDLRMDTSTFHWDAVKDELRGTVTEVQCA